MAGRVPPEASIAKAQPKGKLSLVSTPPPNDQGDNTPTMDDAASTLPISFMSNDPTTKLVLAHVRPVATQAAMYEDESSIEGTDPASEKARKEEKARKVRAQIEARVRRELEDKLRQEIEAELLQKLSAGKPKDKPAAISAATTLGANKPSTSPSQAKPSSSPSQT
jgi:hypothetical protein